jgi:oligoendopeptidase F
MKIAPPKRHFLPQELKIKGWNSLKPFYEDLAHREVNSTSEMEQWVLDLSELEAVVSEDAGWRYINMSIDATDETKLKAYTDFLQNIQPNIAPFEHEFSLKYLKLKEKFPVQIDGIHILERGIQKSIEMYREENIPLISKNSEESQKFGAIAGQQSIKLAGETLTMQQAAVHLKNKDRSHREKVYRLSAARRLEDKESLHKLLDTLIEIRQKIAKNADYKNYRDYKFDALGRFDYKAEDCFSFHDSIEKHIVPVIKEFHKERAAAMALEELRPWDMEVDPNGNEPLKPFEGTDELVNKSIDLFKHIDSYCGDCLETMKEMKHLDLASKPGKMPGGYNYPLYEIGVPFIFMNAVGSQRDLVTMIHEGGHAVHSFLSRDLKLTGFKSLPSEIAELASMGMELISMEHWDLIYSDEQELKRAKKEQLQKILMVLPWVASIDSFQHFIYTKEHSHEDREQAWVNIRERFGTGVVKFDGFEENSRLAWQAQLHIYEVPFYYIEYAMAQLGAIALWKNYKDNPSKTLEQYKAALSLGYTKSIPEVYKEAGIKFDFSDGYVKELLDFVKGELERL